MSDGCEKFWSGLPEKVRHPACVPVLEALRWIDEPLSAIALVDVLDGGITMWDAARHLQALEETGVVEACPEEAQGRRPRNDSLDVPYRLRYRDKGKGA